MKEIIKGWCRLPMSERALRTEVDKYFEKCAEEGTPPTPSGLALALGVRTSALSDERLSIPQRAVIDRAMQRIEASTMELMLTRGGVKGMENVLERVEESEEEGKLKRAVGKMTDEEIFDRLRKMEAKIGELLGEDG